jgi:hypothetical protein
MSLRSSFLKLRSLTASSVDTQAMQNQAPSRSQTYNDRLDWFDVSSAIYGSVRIWWCFCRDLVTYGGLQFPIMHLVAGNLFAHVHHGRMERDFLFIQCCDVLQATHVCSMTSVGLIYFWTGCFETCGISRLQSIVIATSLRSNCAGNRVKCPQN